MIERAGQGTVFAHLSAPLPGLNKRTPQSHPRAHAFIQRLQRSFDRGSLFIPDMHASPSHISSAWVLQEMKTPKLSLCARFIATVGIPCCGDVVSTFHMHTDYRHLFTFHILHVHMPVIHPTSQKCACKKYTPPRPPCAHALMRRSEVLPAAAALC